MLTLWNRLPLIVRKAAVFLPLRVGGLLIQFVSSILIARLIGPDQFGAYTYAFVWATMVGVFLTLGLEQLTIREMPGFVERGEAGAARGFLMTLWTTLGIMTGLAGLAFWSLETLGIMTLAPGWLLVTGLAALHGLTLALASLLTGLQRITTSQVLESIPRSIIFIGLVGLSYLVGHQLDPAWLFLLTILAGIPVLIITMRIAWKAVSETIAASDMRQYRRMVWYGAGLPIAISALSQTLKNNTDIIMIGAMLGDFDTGIYRAAARGAFLASFAGLIAVRVLAPMLSRAIARQDMKEAQTLLSYSALLSTLMGLAVCLVLGIEASVYLGLFGPAFTEAAEAMRILIWGRAFEVLTAAVGLVLIMFKHERIVFVTNLAGLLANIALNYVLINRIGIEGAAISTSVTTVIVNGILLVAVLRRVGLDPTPVSALRLVWARLGTRGRSD